MAENKSQIVFQQSGIHIVPPGNFSFKASDWEKWLSRFKRYREVSELFLKEPQYQVSTLIYLMGEEAEQLLLSLQLTDTELQNFDTVIAKITQFYTPKVNIIYERAKFNSRIQQEGESIDTFVADLHHLAKSCKFGSLQDELVRDRIVIGILDKKLSEQLQLDDKLTLQKCIERVMQSAMIKEQQTTLKKVIEIDNLNKPTHSGSKNFNSKKFSHSKNFQKKFNNNKPEHFDLPCKKCNNKMHFVQGKCPAEKSKCRNCHNIGHWAIYPFDLCKKFSKNKNQGKNLHFQKQANSLLKVDKTENQHNSLFIGLLDGSKSVPPWQVTISVNYQNKVNFTIDSGSCVNAIPYSLYHKSMGILNKASECITGPSKEKLNIVGKIKTIFSFHNKSCSTLLYVVKNLSKPLLGRSVLKPLNIVNFSANFSSLSIDWEKKYPKLFSGLGCMPGEYKIVLKKDAKPFSVSVPRRIPLPLLPKVKEELSRLEKMDVIKKQSEPTDWCAPIVVVPKPSGGVRITTDFTQLNQNIKREKFELPGVDYILGQLSGSKYFSKIDAFNGFFQYKLSESSSKLTCFITPNGRYVYKRLPQGACSSPEVFSKKMSEILSGLNGVICMIDDICVFAPTIEEHNKRLDAVLKRLSDNNITLNSEKCKFGVTQFRFLGYIVDESGIHADPEKINAIKNFPTPTNQTEVRRWLGLLNQLAKFIKNLSEKTKPIRSLLQKNAVFYWGPEQEECFSDLKNLLVSTEVLCHYNTQNETRIMADASQNGLGAVLLQKNGQIWRPVAYSSRTLTEAESRWAIIELETAAIVFACSRFRDYLIGLPKFEILTDHAPLVSLLNHKRLDELPIRLQRLRLKIAGLPYQVTYVKGTSQTSADCLSRAPLKNNFQPSDFELQDNIQDHEICFIQNLPVSAKKLDLIIEMQKQDPILSKIRYYCQSEWPSPKKVPIFEKPYLSIRSELSIVNDVLCKSNKIVVPQKLRPEMLDRIHEGHLGIVKSLERARSALWWPNYTSQIKTRVSNCTTCAKHFSNRSEPLIPTDFPNRPWEKIGADLFTLYNKTYLIVVDYYSRWIECPLLTSTSSESVISQLKSIFAKYGICDTLISDNGPQFSSHLFSDFAKFYGFQHITSSPLYPQGNAEAERGVQTVKSLLKKSFTSKDDPYLALLSYRSTPLKNGYSPAELLMGRKLRTRLPILPSELEPNLPNDEKLKAFESNYRNKYKNYADKHRGSRNLRKIDIGEKVFLKREGKEGIITGKFNIPRSYKIKSNESNYRRNRKDFVILPSTTNSNKVVENSMIRRSPRINKGVPPLRYPN